MARLMIAFLALVAFATGALAHASLLRSSPADGAVLAAAPPAITLTFNETVAPLVMRLVGTDGTPTDLTDVEARDATVVVKLPAVGAGTHALSWRVISADGHPVGGTMTFSVGTATGSTPSATTETPVETKVLIWLSRLAIYCGVVIGIGGRFAIAWLASGEATPTWCERTMTVALCLLLPMLVVALGLQGVDALGVPLRRLGDPLIWTAAVDTTYAGTLGALAVAALLALPSGRRASLAGRREVTAVALLAVGVAFALSGHASDAAPQWVARSCVALHTMMLTFWLGALLPLVGLVTTGRRAPLVALMRFSRAIPLPLALVVVTGSVLAVLELEHLPALWTTAYGRILFVKVALVAVLLALAGLNRFAWTVGADAGDAAARANLGRSIVSEMVIAAAILGLVAAWRFTPPPRALAATPVQASPIHLHIHGERAMAEIEIQPGRIGPVAVTVRLQASDAGPMTAEEVAVTMANKAAGIEPIRKAATRSGEGEWHVDHVTLPASGAWAVKVDILVSDFQQVSLEGQVQISP